MKHKCVQDFRKLKIMECTQILLSTIFKKKASWAMPGAIMKYKCARKF